MGTECELKLALAPSSLGALAKIPLLQPLKVRSKRQREISVYFDTDKHKLKKAGLILRVRRIRKHHIQTIKTTNNGSLFGRNEWENEIAGEAPDLSLAAGTALEPFITKKVKAQLKPLFETRMQRTFYPLENDGCEIAFTVDRGTVDTATQTMPVCEIELELKRGSPSHVFDVAREIANSIPVSLAFKSKSERGFELIAGSENTAVKASAIALPTGTLTFEALKKIGYGCLQQIIDNEAAVINGDSEGVHQMRIGLRRLRSAISLFGEFLIDPESNSIKNELKWATSQLTPAREFDVLHDRVLGRAGEKRKHAQGLPLLSDELAEKRAEALAQAQEMIRSHRFRLIALNVAGWLEVGQWMNPADDLLRARGQLPIELFAAEEMERRWRKIRKKGKKIEHLDARRRHKLRIQAKKVRYATEFFADIFAAKQQLKQRKKVLAALEQVQDALGDLNDIAVHQDIISAMGLRKRTSSKRAFAAGLLSGREDARGDESMKAATKALARVMKVEPYWH